MSRYAREHHAKSNAAIIDAASSQLRLKGYDGVSIAEVMGALGLTHGGFYAHFKNRDALVEAALKHAFDQSHENFRFLTGLAVSQADNGLIARHYLAKSRVDNVSHGCPLVALSTDSHRMPLKLRKTFDQCVWETRSLLHDHFRSAKSGDMALSSLVGGLILLRMTSDAEQQLAIRANAETTLRQL